MRIIDRVGNVYGRLTVIAKTTGPLYGRTYWLCRCVCNRTTRVLACNLSSGNTTSCGCWIREQRALTHRTHGGCITNPIEYTAWLALKGRCHNPRNKQYRDYGGRGITVCERWRLDFAAFLSDMGPKPSPDHSIDRINNDGPYSPENCRWATDLEQNHNTRVNIPVGPYPAIAAAARAVGLKRTTLQARLRAGWAMEDALTVPVGSRKDGHVRLPLT